MSTFVRVLKIVGRALRRAVFAIGRFFKFLFKKIGKSSKVKKLKRAISKKEAAVEKLYSEIGRSYYEAHSDEPEALLAGLCGSVGENKAQIAASQEAIAGLQAVYAAARAAAKEQARAVRAADKAAAAADKAGTDGTPETAAESVSAAEEAAPAAAEPVTESIPEALAPAAEAVPAPEAPVVMEEPAAEDHPAEPEAAPAAEGETVTAG